MKAIWKILIGATAVAAVTPYKVKKDEETGVVTLKAATWAGTYTKSADGRNLTVKLLPGIIKPKACKCEDECCCEDACECEAEPKEDEGGIVIELDVQKEEDAPAEEPEPEAE